MMGLKNGYPKLYTILRVRLVCLVLVAFVFIFSACGETTEEADNRLEVMRILKDEGCIPSEWREIAYNHPWGSEVPNYSDFDYYYIDEDLYSEYEYEWTVEDVEPSKLYKGYNDGQHDYFMEILPNPVFHAISVSKHEWKDDIEYRGIKISKGTKCYIVSLYNRAVYYNYVSSYSYTSDTENSITISTCADYDMKSLMSEYLIYQKNNQWVWEKLETVVTENTYDNQTSPSEVCEEKETITEEVITKENTEITICMVGDVLLHTPIEDYSKNEENEYDYSPIFANVKKEIESVDLAIVNQEVIIGGRELGVSGYPAFNAPTEIGDELVKTGFDVVCHATNHALDKGKKGLINCCSFWNEEHPEIAMLGIHESSEDAENLYIYEKNGLKIAILNYTYGTNGISLPDGMPYCVDLLNEDKVKSDIARAETEADFTIVVPHWGTEYLLTPDSMQKKWTKIFMENGVDLVIGAHPHVIEPVEMMEDEETGRNMLVYYSLGNFVNWTSGTGEGVANRMVGGMAKVTISSEDLENTGELSIKEYGVEGLVSHVTSQTGGITVYPISEYNSQLAGENEIVNQDSNFSYEYCVELCDRVWGDLYH